MKINSKFDPVPLWYVAECMTCGERFENEESAKHHAEVHNFTHAITIDPGEERHVKLRKKNIQEFIKSKFHEYFDKAMESFMNELEQEYLNGSLNKMEVYAALHDVLENKSICEETRSKWLRFTSENDNNEMEES